jgi:hypothetical protein
MNRSPYIPKTVNFGGEMMGGLAHLRGFSALMGDAVCNSLCFNGVCSRFFYTRVTCEA